MMTNGDKISFTLRINDSVHQKISESSKEMGVTKNAFILMVLSEKFTTTKTNS